MVQGQSLGQGKRRVLSLLFLLLLCFIIILYDYVAVWGNLMTEKDHGTDCRGRQRRTQREPLVLRCLCVFVGMAMLLRCGVKYFVDVMLSASHGRAGLGL